VMEEQGLRDYDEVFKVYHNYADEKGEYVRNQVKIHTQVLLSAPFIDPIQVKKLDLSPL